MCYWFSKVKENSWNRNRWKVFSKTYYFCRFIKVKFQSKFNYLSFPSSLHGSRAKNCGLCGWLCWNILLFFNDKLYRNRFCVQYYDCRFWRKHKLLINFQKHKTALTFDNLGQIKTHFWHIKYFFWTLHQTFSHSNFGVLQAGKHVCWSLF